MKKILEYPPLSRNAGLEDYADQLRCCKETLTAMNYLQEFESQQNLKVLVEKLPYRLRMRWLTKNHEIRNSRNPKFEDVVQFIETAACEVSDPVFGTLADLAERKPTRPHSQTQKLEPRQHARGSFAVQTSTILQGPQPSSNQEPCWCCEAQHKIYGCPVFKALRIKERINLVKQKGLCMNCFARGHLCRDCPIRSVCGIEGCSKKHSRFLHLRRLADETQAIPTETAPAAVPHAPMTNAATASATSTASSSFTGAKGGKVALPIVPIRVHLPLSPLQFVDTYALLDQGSTCTFCSDTLADRLNAPRNKEILELTTLSGKETLNTTYVHLKATTLDHGPHTQAIDLKLVYTRPTIGVGLTSLVSDEELRSFKHFKGIKVPNIQAEEVHVIIGNDVPEALVPLEVRSGRLGEPYATRTRFGWAINGPVIGDRACTTTTSYFIDTNASLQRQVAQFWELENLGGNPVPHSDVDREVLDDWEVSAERENGHYMLHIPFKKGMRESMRDNRTVAEHRLASLAKRLAQDDILRDQHTEQMNQLVEKGYAEHVSHPDQCEGIINYLPHHAVIHPKKPGKVRIVFDCAAKYESLSLNDRVHQGPDLTNKLIGVLLRFRQDSIAFMADIEAMFHQVKVTPSDRDVLRFLWWSQGKTELEPLVYRMTTHVFGGVWSPSAANYALRQCATDHQECFSQMAVETVLRNFYVDDCLKSVSDAPTAVSLLQELRELLGKGAFRLTKWMSNSRKLLEAIPPEEHVKGIANLDLSQQQLPPERALGVLWKAEDDLFGFEVTTMQKPMTRRGVLSTLSSIYDPMGFLSPYSEAS